jgi:hypothetical protein
LLHRGSIRLLPLPLANPEDISAVHFSFGKLNAIGGHLALTGNLTDEGRLSHAAKNLFANLVRQN